MLVASLVMEELSKAGWGMISPAGERPCHSNLHNCFLVSRRALFSHHDFLLFIYFFSSGKGGGYGEKGL